MKREEILSHCDHTLLAQAATWEDIRVICDDGMKYGQCLHSAKLCKKGQGIRG